MLQVLRRLIIPDQVIILENRPPGDAMSVTTDTGETLLIKRETENGIVDSLIGFHMYYMIVQMKKNMIRNIQ